MRVMFAPYAAEGAGRRVSQIRERFVFYDSSRRAPSSVGIGFCAYLVHPSRPTPKALGRVRALGSLPTALHPQRLPNRRLQQRALARIFPIDALQDNIQGSARCVMRRQGFALRQPHRCSRRFCPGVEKPIARDNDSAKSAGRPAQTPRPCPAACRRHPIELVVAWRRRTVIGRVLGLLFLAPHFDTEATAEHRNHRVLMVNRLGRVQFLAGTVQEPMPLAPKKELQMLFDVAGLDGRPFLPISFPQVTARKFDAGRVNLQLLIGQRHQIMIAVTEDVALDDLPIA